MRVLVDWTFDGSENKGISPAQWIIDYYRAQQSQGEKTTAPKTVSYYSLRVPANFSESFMIIEDIGAAGMRHLETKEKTHFAVGLKHETEASSFLTPHW